MSGTEIVIKIDILYFLGVIGTLLAITWYASSRFGKVENSIEWIKREMDRIQRELDWIKSELTGLWDAVKGREASRAGVESVGSPIQPTELGWKYIKESGLGKIVDEEKREELLKKLRDLLGEDYTEYDAQESARRILMSSKNDPAFRPIKDYAFNNGIDADVILRLGGLLLRDNFLKIPHHTAASRNEAE